MSKQTFVYVNMGYPKGMIREVITHSCKDESTKRTLSTVKDFHSRIAGYYSDVIDREVSRDESKSYTMALSYNATVEYLIRNFMLDQRQAEKLKIWFDSNFETANIRTYFQKEHQFDSKMKTRLLSVATHGFSFMDGDYKIQCSNSVRRIALLEQKMYEAWRAVKKELGLRYIKMPQVWISME